MQRRAGALDLILMNNEIVVGGLYASRWADGWYHISKVLVVDAHTVHLRTYATRFQELPSSIRSVDLSLGGFGHPEGFGIGHFPLARDAFEGETRVLLTREEVSYEELDGYRIWAGIDPIESE